MRKATTFRGKQKQQQWDIAFTSHEIKQTDLLSIIISYTEVLINLLKGTSRWNSETLKIIL